MVRSRTRTDPTSTRAGTKVTRSYFQSSSASEQKALAAGEGVACIARAGGDCVVTARPENAAAVLEVFERRGLVARAIGRVTEERRLIMRRGEEVAVLFNLETECVTGIH